ncbi:hypothetical protein D3C83_303220 [compost metagenome]
MISEGANDRQDASKLSIEVLPNLWREVGEFSIKSGFELVEFVEDHPLLGSWCKVLRIRW